MLHLGPRSGDGESGGIAAVIDMHRRLPYSAARAVAVPTFVPGARLWSGEHATRAAATLLRRRRGRRRTVVHVHLAGGGSVWREGGLARLASRLGYPVVVTVHASDLDDVLRENPDGLRRVLAAADVVHALGPSSVERLQTVLASSARVEVIPNALAALPATTPLPDGPPVVLFAGVVGRRKGVDLLLDAWPSVRDRVPGARLLVAGPPDDVRVPAGLAGAEWLGVVPRAHVAHLLAGSHLAVLPSRQEAQPVFLLEAMAAGRAVLSTAIAEIPALVPSPRCVVPPDDADALGRRMIELLTDVGGLAALGLAGRRLVEERHGPGPVSRRFEEVYRSVVDGQG